MVRAERKIRRYTHIFFNGPLRLIGMDLPEQKCSGLLGFALRREDPLLKERNIGTDEAKVSHLDEKDR